MFRSPNLAKAASAWRDAFSAFAALIRKSVSSPFGPSWSLPQRATKKKFQGAFLSALFVFVDRSAMALHSPILHTEHQSILAAHLHLSSPEPENLRLIRFVRVQPLNLSPIDRDPR